MENGSGSKKSERSRFLVVGEACMALSRLTLGYGEPLTALGSQKLRSPLLLTSPHLSINRQGRCC